VYLLGPEEVHAVSVEPRRACELNHSYWRSQDQASGVRPAWILLKGGSLCTKRVRGERIAERERNTSKGFQHVCLKKGSRQSQHLALTVVFAPNSLYMRRVIDSGLVGWKVLTRREDEQPTQSQISTSILKYTTTKEGP